MGMQYPLGVGPPGGPIPVRVSYLLHIVQLGCIMSQDCVQKPCLMNFFIW